MILHRVKDGIEDDIEEALDERGVRENDEAVDLLNDVLLPAMKDVGDKFGARRADPAVRAAVGRGDEEGGQATRAVPRQGGGLHEGQGRARDRVRRRARHRQVPRQHDPLQQRLHGVRPRQAGAGQHDPRQGVEVGADAIGLSALLVSTSKQMPLCVQELDARGLDVPGADRRRGDQPLVRPAHALPRGRAAVRAAASSTARTRSRGSTTMDVLRDARRRGRGLRAERQAEADKYLRRGRRRARAVRRPSSRASAPTCRARPCRGAVPRRPRGRRHADRTPSGPAWT